MREIYQIILSNISHFCYLIIFLISFRYTVQNLINQDIFVSVLHGTTGYEKLVVNDNFNKT